jgi:type IV pilus assembly protein PilM
VGRGNPLTFTMALLSSKKPKSLVGLDIETGSIAATEVRVNGSTEVVGGGVMPLGSGVFREGEVADPDALGQAIKELFAREKLPREVRVGIANQRVAVRSMRLPAIDDRDELETAIRFQAQDHIPMPLDQAVLDWQVIGHTTDENGDRKVDVVAVAARRDMIGQVLKAVSVAGLRPIGIDHSAFGMIRALAREVGAPVGPGEFVSAPPYEERTTAALAQGAQGGVQTENLAPAKLYCNLGDVTNLAVARGSSCLFTRLASFGVEGIAQKLAERRRLTVEHSRQWLVHVGLEQSEEAIEGDPEHVSAARECLADGADRLANEIRASMDYYAAQDGSIAVEDVVVCGPGTQIPGLVERLQRTLGHAFSVATPRPLAHLDTESAVRQTLSFGLALEE